MIGTQIGMGRNVAAKFVTGNPNGVLSGTKGSLAVDPATAIVYQNTNGGTTWTVFSPAGGTSSGFTMGSPDGTVTGVVGQQLTDTVTGVSWKNYDGGTTWDPIDIPIEWGFLIVDDVAERLPSLATAIGAGSATSTYGTGAPGQYSMSAAAAGVDGYRLGTPGGSFSFADGQYRMRMRVRQSVPSDGTNNYALRCGAANPTSIAEPTNGIYLETDLSTHGNNNWWLCAATAGVRTKTDTGVVTASNYTLLQLDVTANANTLTAKIAGAATGITISTNIPTGTSNALSAWAIHFAKTLGSSAKSVQLDFVRAWCVLTTKRS